MCIFWWYSGEAPRGWCSLLRVLSPSPSSMHSCGYCTRSLMDAVERDRGGSVRLLLDIESMGSLLVIIIGNRSKLRRPSNLSSFGDMVNDKVAI